MINTIQVNLDAINLTDEQFFQICQNNRDLRYYEFHLSNINTTVYEN